MGDMAELTLEVVEGPDSGRQIPLRATLEIGRDPGVDVRLDDDKVSRRHARISPASDGAVIEDLGSSNGTFVNHNELVSPTRITAGDEVLIGVSVLQLRSAAQIEVQASAVRPVPAGLAMAPRRPTYVDPAVAGPRSVSPELDRLRDARTKTQARLAPLAIFVLAALVVAIYFAAT